MQKVFMTRPLKLPYSLDLLNDFKNQLVMIETKEGIDYMDYFEIDNVTKRIHLASLECSVRMKDIISLRLIKDYNSAYDSYGGFMNIQPVELSRYSH